MSFYSTQYHAMMMSPGKTPGGVIPINTGRPNVDKADAATPSIEVASADKPADQKESFFHHLLDVVNPLQHLPVIGTIYRAITGERLDAVEKIAGDTLYGGLWGAVTSIADVAFESLTGKSFEDTALALFKGDDKARVASTKVAAPTITASISLPSSDLPNLPTVMAANMADARGFDMAALNSTALTNALAAKGVDSDTASRALYAYRRSMGMNVPVPVFASVH
jgi:hypothetical protein